ncbi:MAG: 1-(5-phosphoribosyl)-5-[(5-phosphoribosylamino)methylideneamino]imidazole-4-carboxamide isomerase [Candidatus Woesebacteria bacterium]|jgi:phosphoribosylformimino-5-aminoimidazole carboxamide ribotide isomerase
MINLTKIIPAIDIQNGNCVRLKQGDFSKKTVYASDPVLVAKQWQDQGAKSLHIVDLDGAKVGKVQNLKIIKNIIKTVSIPTQVGGGIRDFKTVKKLIQLGVNRIILGSIALENIELLKKILAVFPDQIIVSLDAKNSKLMSKGWLKNTQLNLIETAQKLEKLTVKRLIYTDTLRDGTETGPNLKIIKKLINSINMPVIMAGGIASKEDIKQLIDLGAEAVIVGKALYDGLFYLNDQDSVDFEKQGGLVPAIVQEESSKEILMLAYMNKRALKKTLKTGYAWFWSRSKKKLWMKGETSGNKLKVNKIVLDCDNDTLLIQSKIIGKNICHTNNKSCFFKQIL